MQLLAQFAQLRMNIKQAVVGGCAGLVDCFVLAIELGFIVAVDSGLVFNVALVVHVVVFVSYWCRHSRHKRDTRCVDARCKERGRKRDHTPNANR